MNAFIIRTYVRIIAIKDQCFIELEILTMGLIASVSTTTTTTTTTTKIESGLSMS
ncbi:hypothetical protein H8356DRAFT_1359884 [Neocallimastix lanati (nom. inval.)]|nr:hypothetical protein H8356DRAFT_1359884 [Neocallimastix sp. JGI-2020a]